jgi:hypothetical protein
MTEESKPNRNPPRAATPAMRTTRLLFALFDSALTVTAEG